MTISKWALTASAAVLVACFATPTFAGSSGTIVVERDVAKYSGSGAGEFKVTTFTGKAPHASGANVLPDSFSLFQTFCLEKNETISEARTYNWTRSMGAQAGGVGGQTSPGYDPLSDYTAWLYTEFTAGTLNNYHYNPGMQRAASADDLQDAIWWLEEELSGPVTNLSSQTQTWISDAQTAVDVDGWTNQHVKVLNITKASDGSQKQDLLVMAPLPPAAAGLLLLGGMGLIGRVRRRMRFSEEA